MQTASAASTCLHAETERHVPAESLSGLLRTRTANSSIPLTRAWANRFSTGRSRQDAALGPPPPASAASPAGKTGQTTTQFTAGKMKIRRLSLLHNDWVCGVATGALVGFSLLNKDTARAHNAHSIQNLMKDVEPGSTGQLRRVSVQTALTQLLDGGGLGLGLDGGSVLQHALCRVLAPAPAVPNR